MELTLEQHLDNIKVAVVKATGTYDELISIRTSFNHIKELVLKPKEVKEEK
jgi:hypothetical protein